MENQTQTGSSERSIVLVDGNSLAYRAFFALPDTLATSDGKPTNAVTGLAAMFTKLLAEYPEVPTVVAWDAGTSGRKDIYSEYKGNRSAKPDLLTQQWPYLLELSEAFGYTNVSLDGYEADDVIGSLAKRAKDSGYRVVVVTGDRDSFQLVDEMVNVLATARGITDTKLYTREAVIERYGIPPELVPDFIGLKGDTSDNIPGVPGIGDKTASSLLQEFGSLEGVLDSIDQISGAKRKENLTNHAEDARMSKQLGTILCDLEVSLEDLADLTCRPDVDQLREMLRSFELRDIAKRLEAVLGEGGPVVANATKPEVKAVKSHSLQLDQLDQLTSKRLALAVSSAGSDPDALFDERESGWRFALYDGSELAVGNVDELQPLLDALSDRELVLHDAKSLPTVPVNLAFDTMIAAYLIEPMRRDYDLLELAESAGIDCTSTEPATTAAIGTWQLSELQQPKLVELGMERLYREVEHPSIAVLKMMEQAGLTVDLEHLAGIRTRVAEEITALEAEIHELAGEKFTIGSPQQLSAVLFERLGLSRKRRGKTGFSTDARVLQAIRHEHPIIEKVERYRELTKLVSTYLDSLPKLVDPKTGRIHTTFNQVTAATGRLSSINPNLQNIPIRTSVGKEIRACFVPAKGMVLTSADYSQVELRVLAHVADETTLKRIFTEGADVHTATAAEVFGVPLDQVQSAMRSKAKMVNYGIVYGLSAFGLADRLGIANQEAQELIDHYFARFPGIKGFIDRTVADAHNNGYVTTIFGRRRPTPELQSSNYQTRQFGERAAVNTVIQGSAADIIKLAMIRCHEALKQEKLATKMILQIHDELLFEGPPEESQAVQQLACREMIAAYDLQPPLEVDAGSGPNWLEAK